jgi:hypothetical protein
LPMSWNIGRLLEQPFPSGRGSGRCNRRKFLPELCRNPGFGNVPRP